MSFSITCSSVAAVRPATRTTIISPLTTQSPRSTRRIWQCASNGQGLRDRMERAERSFDAFHRHHEAKIRSVIESSWPTTAPRKPHGTTPWTKKWKQSRISELAGREKTYWDAELEQMNRRMAKLSNLIARDPYELPFGNQAFFAHYDPSLPAEANKRTEGTNSKTRFQSDSPSGSASSHEPLLSRGNLEYDPISGRMTRATPATQTVTPVSPSTTQSAQSQQSAHAEYNAQPDNQLEARLVAEATRAQLSDPVVDCGPGSELEAFFKASPAKVEATHYTTATRTSDATVTRTHDLVDNVPDDASFATSVGGNRTTDEKVQPLNASDIRARCESPTSNESLAAKFQEDPIYEALQSRQHHRSAVPRPEATYRILAFDSSTASVTTTEADTFFGTSEQAPTHEILSRLHNPANFVRYFGKMQEDGYEIATGGGDILVFKRTFNGPGKSPVQGPATGFKDPTIPADVQADLKNYQMPEDAFDMSRYVHHYDPSSSTIKPSTSGSAPPLPRNSPPPNRNQPETTYSSRPSSPPDPDSSSNQASFAQMSAPTPSEQQQHSHSESKSKSIPKSTFRKILRRMFLTGTITAASCYAMGVLVEYFRTGGTDGRGADGFTAFESERRHGS
ncbi:hypothetical protein N7539_006778 [Penicillium diatomitis]|uniref:Serine-threonine rich protein n=1 Tax=Penicillium diatomitis TaxID=2819901 RepID=A0A9W9X1Y0_9EURO|nr:uncharacterized protein N7539_006778 [Penicillium diatomitis]KAJ5480884.1 hypothetical protein N7539_006778 [Penicillium diatomitis]